MYRAQPLSPNFLELPSEIRHRIYSHLLVDEDTYVEGRHSKVVCVDISTSGNLPRILQGCFWTESGLVNNLKRRTAYYTLDSEVDL